MIYVYTCDVKYIRLYWKSLHPCVHGLATGLSLPGARIFIQVLLISLTAETTSWNIPRFVNISRHISTAQYLCPNTAPYNVRSIESNPTVHLVTKTKSLQTPASKPRSFSQYKRNIQPRSSFLIPWSERKQ